MKGSLFSLDVIGNYIQYSIFQPLSASTAEFPIMSTMFYSVGPPFLLPHPGHHPT